MSDLTEVEIFDCLFTNLRGAIDDCDLLSKLLVHGPAYVRLRDRLKLIEGACRQAAHWREDARWLPLGIQMEQCHQMAAKWLREHYPSRIFLALKAHLETALKVADKLKNDKTGRVGMILPEPGRSPIPGPLAASPGEGPHRDTRPVQVLTTGSSNGE